jgi:hypothetical protein
VVGVGVGWLVIGSLVGHLYKLAALQRVAIFYRPVPHPLRSEHLLSYRGRARTFPVPPSVRNSDIKPSFGSTASRCRLPNEGCILDTEFARIQVCNPPDLATARPGLEEAHDVTLGVGEHRDAPRNWARRS